MNQLHYRPHTARKPLAVVVIIAILFGAALALRPAALSLSGPHQRIMVGEEFVRVVVADTAEERRQGLSDTTGLSADEGMLFVFPEEGHYSFWMKDMRYAIDIIWIASDGRIVGFWPDAAPDSYPRSFSPEHPAQYVLEVAAGYVREHELKIGDVVRI